MVWFVGFYGIATFVGYLTPNPFHFNFKQFKQLYLTIQFSISTVPMSKIVQSKTIQFSISPQFKCKYSLIVKKRKIYIVIHRQICFVLSDLISVARHTSFP